MHHPKALLAWIALSFLPGILGGLFVGPSVDTWYTMLEKPALTPPNWLFAPVWAFLYALMGYAAYTVWRVGKRGKGIALGFFLAHLVVNGLWSYIFFGMQSIMGGFITIIVLLSMILITFVLFKEHSSKAAALLVPYFMWVLFATYLNTMILVLN